MIDTLIRNVVIVDGSGEAPYRADVTLSDGLIQTIAQYGTGLEAHSVIEAEGLVLSPGFIDVHTHDDLVVIRAPEMLPKLSQGVTTVIVGNCGLSAAPVDLRRHPAPPDPLNLLGGLSEFTYPDFKAYVDAINAAQPAVNVAALIGHTALRASHMDDLYRPATESEIAAMTADLRAALSAGALGLSTGLAYATAFEAPLAEVLALAQPLTEHGGIYCTHLRSEFDTILEAMDEAFAVGRDIRVPVVISHLKCAGLANHGRSHEVLAAIDTANQTHEVGCDCYPYAASSSTLDLKQVTPHIDILITWSDPCPEQGGKRLKDIAADWGLDLMATAQRLMPAGAVYFGMSEADVERILSYPTTVIGSDGLPNDAKPHPRLWGAFPRVLGHYSRDKGLFSLSEAIRKMTGQSADRYGLTGRGYVREGYAADLVLFDPATILDAATFTDPVQAAHGIERVWVNGQLSLHQKTPTGMRAGRFLPHTST